MEKLTEAQRGVLQRMADGSTLTVDVDECWLVPGRHYVNRSQALKLAHAELIEYKSQIWGLATWVISDKGRAALQQQENEREQTP